MGCTIGRDTIAQPTIPKETDVNDQLVTDPVCRMKISPADAVANMEHEGTTYYFCSQDCADSFTESPEDYI